MYTAQPMKFGLLSHLSLKSRDVQLGCLPPGLLFTGLLLLSIIGRGENSFASPVMEGVYVVKMQQVIEQSRLGKNAQKQLQADLKKKKGELEKGKIELMASRKAFEKQKALLSKEAVEEKMLFLQKKERDLARSLEDYKKDYARRSSQLIEKIVKEVDDILAGMKAELGARVILELDPRFVVYSSGRADVTARVTEALDAKKTKF